MAQRILIVQPEPDSAHALTRLFVKRGDEVHLAWELGQAVVLLPQARPDYLIFDLHVPDAGWAGFIKNVRRMYPSTRVILTTRSMDLKREMAARELGLNNFWRYPFNRRWLEKILEQAEGTPKPEDAARPAAARTPRRVRFPLALKLTLPYVLITLLVLAGAVLITSQAGSSGPLQLTLLGVGGALLAAAVGLIQSRLITRPLHKVVEAAAQVAQGNLDVKVEARGSDEVAEVSQGFNHMVAGLQEGAIYRDILGRNASQQAREQMRQTVNSGEVRLEGQQMIASVLVSDIRGFTGLSEQVEPATVYRWLNDYYGRLTPILARRGGVVNRFDGDAMAAYFGIFPRPTSPQESAVAACQAALEMLQAIEALNEERRSKGEPALTTGIGINTGVVVSGGLGSADRLHYTLVGEAVNTAQRLESLTRQLLRSGGVMVGHATLSALAERQSDFTLEPLGLQVLKGRAERVQVYQLMPRREMPPLKVML